MMEGFLCRSVPWFLCWGALGLAGLFRAWAPCAFAQDTKGCEGVGYAERAFKEYSPGILQKRLKQNPSDVDALVNLGIRLEEQGQLTQAVNLYERAIQAKPDCYLGYYFAGLAEDGLSGHIASDAQAKIRKALSLNPELRTDPNAEAFLRRHSQPAGAAPARPAAVGSTLNDLVESANHFLIGIGVGLLLAASFLYAARRKQPGSV